MWWFFITAAVVSALDQLVKLEIKANMRLYQSIPVLPDILSITYVDNRGISFGIFGQSDSEVKRWALVGVVLVAVTMIVIYWIKYGRRTAVYDISAGLILGGAMGNLIDRIVQGSVTDFIELGYKMYKIPVFNVADSAITVGVTLFLIMLVFGKEEKKGGTDASDTV